MNLVVALAGGMCMTVLVLRLERGKVLFLQLCVLSIEEVIFWACLVDAIQQLDVSMLGSMALLSTEEHRYEDVPSTVCSEVMTSVVLLC
jgi:hypothetical protein